MRVRMARTGEGAAVYYQGRVLTKVYDNRSGRAAAAAIARALRVETPRRGESVEARVSSGVMYRVLALSSLDYRNEMSFELARRLISEALEMQGAAGAPA
jgi:hypothetical protein